MGCTYHSSTVATVSARHNLVNHLPSPSRIVTADGMIDHQAVRDSAMRIAAIHQSRIPDQRRSDGRGRERRMTVNRYADACLACGATARGGHLVRVCNSSMAQHTACATGEPAVMVIRFSSGGISTRNRRGLCIDAPCRGCCTV